MSQILQVDLTSLQIQNMSDLFCRHLSQAVCMWDCHSDHIPALGCSCSRTRRAPQDTQSKGYFWAFSSTGPCPATSMHFWWNWLKSRRGLWDRITCSGDTCRMKDRWENFPPCFLRSGAILNPGCHLPPPIPSGRGRAGHSLVLPPPSPSPLQGKSR